MSKLKEQFSELRQNTPKRVQWLLLAVAFVVVIILLTLLLSGGDKQEDLSKTDSAPTVLKINPDMINWADVVVGDKKTQTIKVYATAPVKVVDVRWHKEGITGLKIDSPCQNMGQINANLACRIGISYAPSTAMAVETVPVFIDWHDADETDAMKKTDKIVLTLGAVAPKVETKPVAAPKPVVVPELEPEPEEEPEPIVIKEEIKREIETIAPPVKFAEPVKVEAAQEVESYGIPDGCSDFAFPAYGISGRQIGWIKPSGGAYKYHPFSDKDCTNPTGTYNPDNGIITDTKGKKIGTDAEHIGFSVISNGEIPELSNAPAIKKVNRAQQLDDVSNVESGGMGKMNSDGQSIVKPAPLKDVVFGTSAESYVDSTQPYDRSFVLRQYKPIPATIVSDVQADEKMLTSGKSLPVRATVDRNVYSDNGRTVILPAGTLMLGYVTGEIPGPYKTIGRMQIQWYQFIRPDGVEFNFQGENDPFSADAQGRVGVPGRGSSDYMEQFIMPMLTAFVPAAVNLINPVADAFVNQIDLDNNTVVQSGTMRSSELAKNEIITAWNQVAQKLMVDMMDNTVPPFTIAAGTRITVYSPEDLRVVCTEETKNCYVKKDMDSTGEKRRDWTGKHPVTTNPDDPSWVGQARSFVTDAYCVEEDGVITADKKCATNPDACGGYSYNTLLLWCKSLNYESKKALQYDVYREDQQKQYQQKVEDLGGVGSQQFNEQILGVKYNTDGTVQNPYSAPTEVAEEVAPVLTCEDGNPPDANGCCAGEIYTDMGEQGFNCCPTGGGDCFPPII